MPGGVVVDGGAVVDGEVVVVDDGGVVVVDDGGVVVVDDGGVVVDDGDVVVEVDSGPLPGLGSVSWLVGGRGGRLGLGCAEVDTGVVFGRVECRWDSGAADDAETA